MNDFSILYELGLIVGAAALLILLTQRLHIPTIILYIVAGLLLGPMTGLVELTEDLEIISEVGIAFLLFLVGLELSFDKIRDVGGVAVLAGLAQVGFILLAGFGLLMGLGFGPMAAVFLATALTNSSTVLVVKLLDQKGETNEVYGHIIIALNLVKDIVLIVVLTVLAGVAAAEGLGFGQVAGTLLFTLMGISLLMGTSLLSARYVLPRLFSWVAQAANVMFVWSLTWCLLFAAGAMMMGLSPAIGAFLGGVSLAQLPVASDLRRRTNPLTNFFLAVFFVAVGVQMEVGAALSLWPALLALTGFVLVIIPLFTMWITARLGYDERTSFLTGLSMGQISELSFIFAAVGLTGGLIGAADVSLLTLLGLVTIAVSAFLILFNGSLFEAARRLGLLGWMRAPATEPAPVTTPSLRDHVIVVGMNPMGRRLVERLEAQGETVLAIDTDTIKLEGLPGRTMIGDASYASVLEEAHLGEARLIVSALQIEAANNLIAFRARQAGVPTAIHAFDNSVVRDLETLGVDYLIRSKNEGTKQIVRDLRAEGVLT